MTLALVRRDDALRSLAIWGVVVLLNANVLLGVLVAMAFRREAPVSQAGLLLVGWATVALFLAVGAGRSRCGALLLALPIPGRRLWLAHVAAVALAGLAVVAVYVAAVAAHASLPKAGRALAGLDLAGLALLLAAATLLATVLLQAAGPTLARVPFTAGRAAWTAAVLLAPLGLLPALADHGALAAAALLTLTAAAAAVAYGRVPPALALVAREPAAAAARRVRRVPAAAPLSAGSARAGAILGTLRCLAAGPKELIFISFIVLVGLFLGGAASASAISEDTRDLRFLYVPLATYLLFTGIPQKLSHLHRLDPLPVNRRLLFAGLMVPSAIVFVASYGAGAWVAWRHGARTEYVDFSEQEGVWSVRAPLRVHGLAWDGRAPEVGSPWGESHPAELIPISRWSRAALSNPFSAPAGSSARFVALQISRAAEAVYGVTISPEEIERRWLETRPEGTVAGRAPGLGLRAENPRLAPRSGPVFPIHTTLVLAPWLLLSAVLLRAYRAGTARWAGQALFWGVVVLFVLFMVGVAVAFVTGLAPLWIARWLVEIAAFNLGRSVAGTAAAWAVCALLLGAAYRLAEVQFLRMEIPTRPLKYSLLEGLCRES